VRSTALQRAAAPRLREEQKLLTRRLLLEAAKKVFAQRGYGAATVDDVARAAGASRATFYLHFASKAEVMGEIFRSLVPEMREYWRSLDRSLGSREVLRDWFGEAVDWWDKNKDLVPMLHEAAASDRAIAADQLAGMRSVSEEMTAYFAAIRSSAKRAEARIKIELLISQLDAFCTKWIVQKTLEADRETVLDLLTEIWGQMLGVPGGSRSPR
jgi:AcrR family transcriptional regulator